MKGEESTCSSCGFPIRTGTHAPGCFAGREAAVPVVAELEFIDPYGPEARGRDIKQKTEMIHGWARDLGLKEGTDYLVIQDTAEFAGDDYRIAPHETKSFAVGVLEAHYDAFREYIVGQYADERKVVNPKGDVKLYYSWGGRFLVGWDGVPFDTVAMESINPPRVPTHHEEFKSFFKGEYGFDFPTSEVLNPILREISQKALDKYEEALERLKSMRNNNALPEDGYGLVDSLELATMILKDARQGAALVDLPEMIEGAMQDKMAHYADLTYNAGSVANYDRVSDITGVSFPPDVRLDKLFDRWGFDQSRMEAVCRQFADLLGQKGRD